MIDYIYTAIIHCLCMCTFHLGYLWVMWVQVRVNVSKPTPTHNPAGCGWRGVKPDPTRPYGQPNPDELDPELMTR